MNPSTSGWIKKYYSEHNAYQIFSSNDCQDISTQVRKIGFSYGIIDSNELPEIYKSFKYTQEELAKICYLQLLEKIYVLHNQEPLDESKFIQSLISFFEQFIPQKSNIFSSFFEEKNPYTKLENIFALRCKEHFFSQSKNNDFVLNMILLFTDVLAYEAYINTQTEPTIFIQHAIEQLKDITLAIKKENSELDKNDLQIIAFLDKKNNPNTLSILDKEPISTFHTNFILDYIVCNSWRSTSKEMILPDFSQYPFSTIPFSSEMIENSEHYFTLILQKNDYNYQYYKSSNLFDNVIKNSSNYIEVLVSRNKDRLVKELHKNQQLMKLLIDSTHRELNPEEKKMVKKQTIEVVKTIPSLAIFVLPGGSILLPVLLRFIPSLLPSSFNENTDDSN